MAYARKRAQDAHETPNFTVVPRLDIANHPHLQVLDIIFDDEQWRVINFYNDARDDSGIRKLMTIDIDAVTPTLVAGDFNLHSPSWSPPDIPRSSWAGRVEEWAASNLLSLANNPGEITRRGAEHERDSVIDLAWYNEAAIQSGTFSGLRIDWEGSLGSDHAMLSIEARTQNDAPPAEVETDLGYVIDPERKKEWIQTFKSLPTPPPLAQTPTTDEVEKAATAISDAIQHASKRVFRKRRPLHRKAAPWWNAACALATQQLREARGTDTRKTAQARLKGAVRAAKRAWADDYIESAELWDVASWRLGRRISKVPSLKGPEGLVHAHEDIAEILSHRFFVDTPPQVEEQFQGDPDPRPTRPLPPISKELIGHLLTNTSNKSAPGHSGHTWVIIKWAWEADAERITDLLTACLRAGHHPRLWKVATVCVIPKPNRADYTLAKNFRPISLLECMGKLLEKLVAKLIYSEMTKHSLVPTTQFGGRNASSTLDAGLTLVHDIQSAHQSNLRTGLLLFDIQGFFDNVNHARLVAVFANLGFAPQLVDWCRSFLKDRTVRLKFNGRTSDPFDFLVGTPQGSPVSPVLSIIYTSPLLHKMKEWNRTSLGMYIDDGAIFACGREWNDIEKAMRDKYAECAAWLTKAGLNIEPEKTELIFFRRQGDKSAPPPHIHLPIPTRNTQYQVQATNTLRYLGFHFDGRLTWTHHVDIMCNRARASIKALQLLGNSVRGLDHVRWRLAYNAICLPVLTYGCQLWYRGKQITLVKKLQVVQNEAVKVISGAFRTTPREPLHQLLNIFPVKHRLDMLTQSTALRLYRLPKNSQLLIRLGDGWHQPDPNDLPLPTPNRRGAKTTLRDLAAKANIRGPRISPFPDLPANSPAWNGRVGVLPRQEREEYGEITKAFVDSCLSGATINVFCVGVRTNRNREDGKQLGAASAVLYQQGRESCHAETTLGESVTESDTAIRSLLLGLITATDLLAAQAPPPQTTLMLFTPSPTAAGTVLDASPHDEQETSIKCMEKVEEILNAHPDTTIRLAWLPRNAPFVGFKRAKQLAFEAVRTATPAEADEPHTIKSQKKRAKEDAVEAWATDWHQAPRTSLAYRTALTRPPDGRPHPSFHAERSPVDPRARKVKCPRRTRSTFYRFVTGHAFVGEYTQRFFPQHTQDQIACPCGEPVQTIEHVLLHCPTHTAARLKHLTAHGRPSNLTQLFANPKRVAEVLSFLEETSACDRPREVWDPG
jgi:hypothetical protein